MLDLFINHIVGFPTRQLKSDSFHHTYLKVIKTLFHKAPPLFDCRALDPKPLTAESIAVLLGCIVCVP